MPRAIRPDRVTKAVMPPLGFPLDSATAARIDEDSTVWVFSDIHGVRSGLAAALRGAGLIDDRDGWIGPPGTALVGLGDYIDRGADSVGVIELLVTLGRQAASAGSRVVLVRGNHEQMVLDVARGDPDWLAMWLSKGGTAYLRSMGWDPDEQSGRDPAAFLVAHHQEIEAVLSATLPYATWRDVLMIHAAPPPGIKTLEDLVDSDTQMWEATAFLASKGFAKDKAFRAYRKAGVGRIVMGHVPQVSGPNVVHGGTVMLVDTNASGKAGGPDRAANVTLVRIGGGPGFDDVTIVTVDTSDAPDRARPREAG